MHTLPGAYRQTYNNEPGGYLQYVRTQTHRHKRCCSSCGAACSYGKNCRNVHEVWAAGRIAEGWTYGEKKDNDLKTTPLLVPYDELAESEKEYDRNTALETLKLIVKMGYGIELRDPNQ